jgi:GTPase SAR1 family protein
VVIGEHDSGRSSLIARYIYNTIDQGDSASVDLSYHRKVLGNRTLNIYECSSDERFTQVHPLTNHFKFSNVALVTLPSTLDKRFFTESLGRVLDAAPLDYAILVAVTHDELADYISAQEVEEICQQDSRIIKSYWCSTITGKNVEEIFQHAIRSLDNIRKLKFCDLSKQQLMDYRGYKAQKDKAGPVTFFNSRCNFTAYLLDQINDCLREADAHEALRSLACILFDHYRVIRKVSSALSLAVEDILLKLYQLLEHHSLLEHYHEKINSRSSLKVYKKSSDPVCIWFADLESNVLMLPARPAIMERFLEFIQALETSLRYKLPGDERRVVIEQTIGLTYFCVDHIYETIFAKPLDWSIDYQMLRLNAANWQRSDFNKADLNLLFDNVFPEKEQRNGEFELGKYGIK